MDMCICVWKEKIPKRVKKDAHHIYSVNTYIRARYAGTKFFTMHAFEGRCDIGQFENQQTVLHRSDSVLSPNTPIHDCSMDQDRMVRPTTKDPRRVTSHFA